MTIKDQFSQGFKTSFKKIDQLKCFVLSFVIKNKSLSQLIENSLCIGAYIVIFSFAFIGNVFVFRFFDLNQTRSLCNTGWEKIKRRNRDLFLG